MADIVDTAIATPGFSTLVAAVKAAGLVETLKGKGPFTVFAPTDAAFAKLPAGTVEGLLKDIPTLKNILTYHVVSGVQKPTRNGRTYTTVNGKEINVKVTVDTTESFIWGGQTNPAKVTNLGIAVDNGSIVVIDEVLLPYPGDEPPVHN
eukprot:CAMPEP_0196763474 /NCGR_PEP_ID=MMETSP1095-20130614/4134_1 /TAXON_ID=96789 ORGANISM="Chromulina nebulosa, Strain UTEXLB2642" /NCGR_SAMPLE_ID=MMETSP1095 /ASSEMBLY_ACC=CAM_ASM_000446 /LENGTH=148 /DNA_ID=CAMNT_0042116721 /DNA_START=176 /DNA_END=622 /DNA_ORIENTATION=+